VNLRFLRHVTLQLHMASSNLIYATSDEFYPSSLGTLCELDLILIATTPLPIADGKTSSC
jgi:hypothetical protein